VFALIFAGPECNQIINLATIKPKDQIGINLGSMLKETDCDIACTIRVNKCILHDKLFYFFLFMFNEFALLGGGRHSAANSGIMLIEVIIFNCVLHLLNYGLLGVLAGDAVAALMF
jgi:hypothetical protein